MSLRRGSAHTTYRTTDPHTGTARYFTGSPYNASPAYWLTEIDDRNGNGITYSRQSAGAPATVSHDGGYQAQAVTGRGRIESLLPRTPSGPVTVLAYDYDERGNPNAVTNSCGLPLRFTYDAAARITSWTDPQRLDLPVRVRRRRRRRHTHFDLPTARTAPDGVRHVLRHDSELRLTEVTNAQGLTWRYGYDSTGQLASETDFSGHTLAYAHDPASQGVAHGTAAAAGRPVTVCRPCVSGPVTRTAPAESTRPAAATAAQDPFRRRMDLGQGAVEPVRDPSGHAGQVVVAVDRPRRVGLRRARGADFR
ncbi:hypothetical protein [Streptomyces sp. NBC_01367]|uniref:hypothetical protein n=1 Tax=Streptomyces sp. NBC_01367 TaxID=2903841 RepID=UPI00386863C7